MPFTDGSEKGLRRASPTAILTRQVHQRHRRVFGIEPLEERLLGLLPSGSPLQLDSKALLQPLSQSRGKGFERHRFSGSFRNRESLGAQQAGVDSQCARHVWVVDCQRDGSVLKKALLQLSLSATYNLSRALYDFMKARGREARFLRFGWGGV